MVSLEWLGWIGFFLMLFNSPLRLCLQTKLPSFLMTGYTGKCLSVVRNFEANENAALVV